MTLNKAQGKTFSRGLLLLTRDVFAHGQLYIGLTRFKAASDVAVLVSPERRIDGRAVVLNVVSSSLAQPVYQFASLRPEAVALDLLLLIDVLKVCKLVANTVARQSTVFQTDDTTRTGNE